MNLRSFFGNLRQAKQNLSRGSKDSIKVCPMCLEPIAPESSWVGGWLTPARYLCNECNYKGYLFVETDLESLKSVLEEKEKEKLNKLEEQTRKVQEWDRGTFKTQKEHSK